jgi:hypothetical protein
MEVFSLLGTVLQINKHSFQALLVFSNSFYFSKTQTSNARHNLKEKSVTNKPVSTKVAALGDCNRLMRLLKVKLELNIELKQSKYILRISQCKFISLLCVPEKALIAFCSPKRACVY